MALIENDEAVVAHYAIDLDRQSSALRKRVDASGSVEATIHDLTIERVELLSHLFAGKRRYGAVGYGHRMSLAAQILDDANKPGVLADNLHPTWAPRFNALVRGYVERRFRPENWAEYFGDLQSIRNAVLSALNDLRQAIATLKRLRKSNDSLTLENPTSWDDCRKRVNGTILLPKTAVDEWGFVTESMSGRGVGEPRNLRYSGLFRFAPIRDAVNEYTRTVGNFMSQALDCLVLVPHLTNAETQSAKNKLLTMAAEHGIKENSLHLSIVNGVDACIAVGRLQEATREVFGNAELPGADAAFCEHERQEFISIMTSWCMFVHPDKVTSKRQGPKNKRGRKKKLKPASDFGDLLTPTKNRLKNSLRGLRQEGIEAAILSETVPWNGKSALWISCDTSHPIATLNAIEKVWSRLFSAFAPDRGKIVRAKAFDFLWSEIILVPLVDGKSLEGQALPHFRGVTYVDAPDLQQCPWRLFPEDIPNDAWARLGLDRWEAQPNWEKFDRFATAYGLLFHHVDHMADFNRLPDDLDDLGISVLQSYLDHETTRAQPLLQEVFDTCADVLNELPEIDDDVIEKRPNIYLCMQILVEMKDAIYPTPDFHESAKLSMPDVVDWRDKLHAGLQQLVVGRCLWIADSFNFGASGDLS